MPVVGAAAITGAFVLGGAKIQSDASKRASGYQEKANSEALAYEKERLASYERRQEAADEEYRQRYDAWLERNYGVKPTTPSAGGGGVSAFSGGGQPSGGGAGALMGGISPRPAQPGAMGVGPRPGGSIADLILAQGQSRAKAAMASGNLWGGAFQSAGAGLGTAISGLQQKPKQEAQFQGAFEPGVDRGVIAPWQPAEPAGWSDWRHYLGTGL